MSYKIMLPLPKLIMDGKYKLEGEIGSGSFGVIYQAVDVVSGEQYAVKVENARADSRRSRYCLPSEVEAYKVVSKCVGFPRILHFGQEENYYFCVMDLLGDNLEDLLEKCSGKFSAKTVLLLAQQMLLRVGVLHERDYVHRDLKPENFMIGRGDKSKMVHLIDLGMAKQYRNPNNKRHMLFYDGRGLIGTARFCSKYSHLGYQLSRRDDLWSLGYILVYFMKGTLPWIGYRTDLDRDERYRLIGEMKQEMSSRELCKGCPSAFREYFRYVNFLSFSDNPDYHYLMDLFKKSLMKRNKPHPDVFDWDLSEEDRLAVLNPPEKPLKSILKKPKTGFSEVNQKAFAEMDEILNPKSTAAEAAGSATKSPGNIKK